jgi:hypothetical protein
MGNYLAFLLSVCRVRAMRGSLLCAPLLGYWILAVVVSLELRAQWTLAVFGPPLVLMAWLDARYRGHAIVAGQPGAKAGFRREGWPPARRSGWSGFSANHRRRVTGRCRPRPK